MDFNTIDVSNLTQAQLQELITCDKNDEIFNIDGIFDVKPIDSPSTSFYYLYIITQLRIPSALDEWMTKNNISRTECIDEILEHGILTRLSRRALMRVKNGVKPIPSRNQRVLKRGKYRKHANQTKS